MLAHICSYNKIATRDFSALLRCKQLAVLEIILHRAEVLRLTLCSPQHFLVRELELYLLQPWTHVIVV